MSQEPQDWHPEDIKAAIRKTGITLVGLAVENDLSAAAVRVTLIKPWARVQAIIAARINRSPQDIWPSRYDAKGNPLAPSDVRAPRHRAPRQKRKAR